jgi:hypothetical protein
VARVQDAEQNPAADRQHSQAERVVQVHHAELQRGEQDGDLAAPPAGEQLLHASLHEPADHELLQGRSRDVE